MSKIIGAVILVFLVELVLWMFGSDIATTVLFEFIDNPDQANALWVGLIGIMSVLAVSVITGSFFQLNLPAVFAGVAGMFLYFGLSLFHMSSWIHSQISSLTYSLSWASVLTMLIVAPFLLYYVITCVEWVRSN